MNKVFKVIWNEARNAYVVVSEMAKSHGTKSCSTKKLLAMLIATGVMTCASVAPVMAANLAPTDTKIEAGDGASASGQGSVAIGQNAAASGLVGIAIGRDAIASGTDSIAIGSSTKADQTFSVAVGNDIKFTAYAGTAVGQQAYASGDNATAIGTMTNVDADYNRTHDDWRKAGAQSTAIGAYAGSWGIASTAVGGFSKAEGKLATAVGYNSKANVDYGTALGDYSEVTAGWGVAIGASSVADRESGVVGAFAPEGADSLTWRANGGAVSVGSATLTRQITNVAAGSEATDAVNVAQLKAATENAGWNLSTGKEITNPTKVKSGAIVDFSGDDENITVSKEETEFATLVNVKLNRNLNVDSVNAGDYFMGAESGIGFGGEAYITQSGLNANDKVITNVAAGVYNTDAVNVGQLKEVEEVAANANKGWNLSTNGVATEATNVAPGEYVDFSGDKNISVSNDKTKVKAELNKDLVDIESISNGDAKLTLGGLATELTNGQGASVKLFGDATIINGKVNVYNDGRIAGVAAGINDTDAVNVSQLKNSAWKLAANGVLTEAEDVKAGDYVDFSGDQNVSVSKDVKDGVKTVKVELNKDLVGIETISNDGASLTLNGTATELTNGKGAAITLFGDTTTINNKVTVYNDGRISGVAAGINDTDAVNVSQLKAVGTTANMGWNLATNGVATEATNVKPGDYVDFSGDKNISVSHDGTKVKVELNKDIDVNSVQTNALNSKYNLSVGTMAENGIMPFFVNSTGAFYAAHNKFSVDKDGNMNANSVQTNALNSKYNLSVGTANENGTVPFFVNSNGAFYAANGKLVVDKDGKVTATAGEIGNVVLNNGVYTGHSALRDGELFVGDASGNYSQITTKGAKLGQVTIAADGKISGVAAGAVTADSTDAVNGSQLHQTNVDVAQNKADIAQNKADIAQNKADIAANRADIDKNKADIAANRADIDKNKADIAQNKADIAANRADIDKNKADIAQNKTDIKNLDNRVTNVEELAKKHTTVTAGDNITVSEDTNKDGGKEYKVALDKDIKLDSVTTGQTVMNNDGLKVGENVSVTATAVTAGKTSISDEGVKVGDKTYISDKGLNANDQNVTNVKAGELSETSKDAVNGSQLYKTNQEVANNTNRINQLGSRVNKVGAGAAALAALHPMDFDPDDKLTFSAGYGNYGGENAAAIGAYYRPDEKVMFSVGGTVGNGENMVNAGVSFSLDRTNHVSNSRTAMAREILDLRAEVTELKAMVAKGGLGSIAEDKMKIFPDVAENHWAYEYVGKLAAAGIIEGYPDGNFSGDRMMSRYEFAAMLYRAMQKGAQLDSKIINEFAPEMGRIRVDRISGEDGDRDKIERVRVNAVKGERDHYGNKIAKAEAKAK